MAHIRFFKAFVNRRDEMKFGAEFGGDRVDRAVILGLKHNSSVVQRTMVSGAIVVNRKYDKHDLHSMYFRSVGFCGRQTKFKKWRGRGGEGRGIEIRKG